MSSPETDPTIYLPAEEYDAFVASLDEEPRDLPRLRALLARPSIFAEEA